MTGDSWPESDDIEQLANSNAAHEDRNHGHLHSDDHNHDKADPGNDDHGTNPDNHDQHYDYTVTVFTPTYNRAETLPRAFESLEEQTSREFEWIVVDDNSTDGTRNLVRDWQKQTDFPIRLFVQDNPGKHRAFNLAVRKARGRFFLVLDSDDALVEDGIEVLLTAWETIPDNERGRFFGVSGLCSDEAGGIDGGQYPKSPYDGGYFEMRYRHRKHGESIGLMRTDVLADYPFPTPDETRYVPESIVWSDIAREYDVRYVNEVVGRHYTDEPDRDDQLTGRPNWADAPAFVLWHRTRLNDHLEWFWEDPSTFFVSAAGYARHSFHAGDSIRTQYRRLSSPGSKLLWAVFLPVGYLAYLFDRFANEAAPEG